MAANKFDEWWNDNCAEMFEWDYDNVAKAAWEAAIKSSEALKPPHNSAMDAIELLKRWLVAFERNDEISQLLSDTEAFVQLHHGADVG